MDVKGRTYCSTHPAAASAQCPPSAQRACRAVRSPADLSDGRPRDWALAASIVICARRGCHARLRMPQLLVVWHLSHPSSTRNYNRSCTPTPERADSILSCNKQCIAGLPGGSTSTRNALQKLHSRGAAHPPERACGDTDAHVGLYFKRQNMAPLQLRARPLVAAVSFTGATARSAGAATHPRRRVAPRLLRTRTRTYSSASS